MPIFVQALVMRVIEYLEQLNLDKKRIIKLVEGLTPNLRVCREGQALKLRLKMVVIRGGLV